MYKNERFNYEDIINLPYKKSDSHPHMSAADRAAQFSPFAALTGYDDEIKETARITDKKIELSEDAILLLNERLEYLNANIRFHPEVLIIYFKPDQSKSGGSYVPIRGTIHKIDELEHTVIMDDRTAITIQDIVEIHIESLNDILDY